MKLFVIEDGEYSGYHVVGVFSTRLNAERILAIETGDSPQIVEWDLDPGIKELNKGLIPFEIQMDYFGEILNCASKEYYDNNDSLRVWKKTTSIFNKKNQNVSDVVTGTVWAKNKKHAIKIANEYRSAQIAQNLMTFRGVNTKGVL